MLCEGVECSFLRYGNMLLNDDGKESVEGRG